MILYKHTCVHRERYGSQLKELIGDLFFLFEKLLLSFSLYKWSGDSNWPPVPTWYRVSQKELLFKKNLYKEVKIEIANLLEGVQKKLLVCFCFWNCPHVPTWYRVSKNVGHFSAANFSKILLQKVKTQYVHFGLYTNHFLLLWKILEEISRRSMLFNN